MLIPKFKFFDLIIISSKRLESRIYAAFPPRFAGGRHAKAWTPNAFQYLLVFI